MQPQLFSSNNIDDNDDEKSPAWKNWNPLKDAADMFSNFDDVVDDFMNKRMGNGEVFYGKRKFRPSNRPNTDGRYNGMGLSDKTKIDVTREYRDAVLEERRRRFLEDE